MNSKAKIVLPYSPSLLRIRTGDQRRLLGLLAARSLLSWFIDFPILKQHDYEQVLPLLDRAHPQVQTGFQCVYCDYLTQLARYTRCRSSYSTISRSRIDNDGLNFGIPYVLCARAYECYRPSSISPRRRYYSMRRIMNQASHATLSLRITTTIRIYYCVKPTDIVDNVSDATRKSSGPKWWRGLALGVTRLKAACDGRVRCRDGLLPLMPIRSRMCTETRALTALVHAIVALSSESR